MKKIIVIGFFILFIFISCLEKPKNLNIETERKIDLIINNRKIFLSNLVYEHEKEFIKKKYNLKSEMNFSDVSSVKIEGEFGMYSLFGEDENHQIIDPLGEKIVNKWNSLNYDPNYYFHYDKVVTNIHLSLLKMMDFYNSDDMNKYQDSLKVSLINRYYSNEQDLIKYLNDDYNFKNRMIWKHKNDSILTLIPLKRNIIN